MFSWDLSIVARWNFTEIKIHILARKAWTSSPAFYLLRGLLKIFIQICMFFRSRRLELMKVDVDSFFLKHTQHQIDNISEHLSNFWS